MTLTRPFDPALFGEAAIDAETAELNAQMIELLTDQPEWWIIGADAFRAARRRGEGTPAETARSGLELLGWADRAFYYAWRLAESLRIASGNQPAAS